MDKETGIVEVGELEYIELMASIVSAYVSNNHVQIGDVSGLIFSVYAALVGLEDDAEDSGPPKPSPDEIRKSITHEALISFEDGKPYKTLKRHLNLRGLTPEAYRAKHGLPINYPMTAVSYSEQRSALARSLGLGQQRRKFQTSDPEATPAAEAKSEKLKKVGRQRKVSESAEP